MNTAIQAKAQATKLKEILGGMGHSLTHSQCLEAISKVEGYSDWNTHAADINTNQQRAEDFLTEIMEAHAQADYATATRHLEQIYLAGYPKHEFLKDCRRDAEELGKFLRREFLCCAVPQEDPDGRFPNRVKYVWRGYFEKDEVILTLAIYYKNGTYFCSGYRIHD